LTGKGRSLPSDKLTQQVSRVVVAVQRHFVHGSVRLCGLNRSFTSTAVILKKKQAAPNTTAQLQIGCGRQNQLKASRTIYFMISGADCFDMVMV
jgi:hypothetical protein